jgi:RecA-family ATPase
MTPFELANFYISHGLKVFPCRSRAEETIDQYTGEVTTLGEKTPLLSNGFKGATRFQHIVKRWFTDWPDAAVGLPTGKDAGFFVLDIDNKPGGANGFEWLAEMEAEHGPLPETARVMSPNGGMHVYFKYVEGTRNRGNLGAGVDLRSEGGYVCAAGSVMSDGRAYKWTVDADGIPPIADAPAWLLDLVVRKQAPASTYTPTGQVTNSAYVNAAVDRELADLAGAPMGSRNNSLNDASFALGTFVGAGALPESEARALLQDVARGWGRDWARCTKTIENGLAAGQRSPREIPSAEHDNDNTRLVDITKMIESGLRKAKERQPPASEKPDMKPAKSIASYSQASEKPTQSSDTEPANKTTPTSTHPASQDDKPAILATAFKWQDPRKLPRREFAFGTHYIRKYVSVTVAPGGLGKTANSIVESLAMVSGKPLVGTKPAERLRCWFFNSEDPRDELDRRIMAACIRYKLTQDDVTGLFLDTGREQELVIAVEDKKTGVRIVQPIVEAVVEQIQKHKIDVMIVDPFVSTHQVNENDNGAIDKVAKLWAQIADHTNCAIDIVHHLRKLADREATVEDARGAVSLIGAARSVRILNRMSMTQAEEANISVNDRFGYFSINHGKANLAPMSHKLDWRHLEGVPLGNGRGLTKPQDFAPVVVEWQWPSPEAATEAVPEDALVAIKKRIGGGDYRYDEQAKQWAGLIVADVLNMDLDNKGDKRRVKVMLRKWESDGHFTTEMRPDENSKKRKCMVPVWGEAA